MLTVIESETVRSAVHRALYTHFKGHPELSFDVDTVKGLIAADGVAPIEDRVGTAEVWDLIRATIEDHIVFLWRNGASHTFRPIEVPDRSLAWCYFEGPAA